MTKVPLKGFPRMAFSSSIRSLPSTIEMSMWHSSAIFTPRGSNTLDLDASCSL